MLVHRRPLPSSPFSPKSFGNAEEAKVPRTQVVLCCSSIRPNSQDVGDKGTGIGRSQCREPVVVLERYANGTTKRYLLEDGLDCTCIEKFESNEFLGMDFPDKEYSWIPDFVKHFVLPAGFPGSVSDDYLEYMLLQFPTNVTAWICHALVTSSLLKAAGLGSVSGTTAAASAAAIRWVSKDGIGAVGRLLIGGRFGNLFDDDPKQWRMYADFIGSAGSIFDLSTQLFPAYFLPLASLGNLAKAVARGLKDPSFRVIQNHFAVAGNVGEVAAKEEVWEVAAQLLGLALGILILASPGFVMSYPWFVFIWMSVRLLHLWLRYQSLSVLQFNTVNLKRARILVKSHILHSTIPGCVDCNRRENILSWQRYIKPRIVYGVPLEEMVGGEKSLTAVKMLLKLYANEKYILVVHQREGDFEVLVSFKVGATSLSLLRSVWQTYWLHESCNKQEEKAVDQLERSLLALEDRFEDFMQQLGAAGWDVSQIILKVPDQISVEVLRSI